MWNCVCKSESVCVCVCGTLRAIWGEHHCKPHSCVSFGARQTRELFMCVCPCAPKCVCEPSSHTRFAPWSPAWVCLLSSSHPSSFYHETDKLLSLVQLMPHTLSTMSPSTFFLNVSVCVCGCACVHVWQGSRDLAGRAFLAPPLATFRLRLQGESGRGRRGRDSGEKWGISALVQERSPQRSRGEASHLSSIKLCKVGMGESGRLRSDGTGREDNSAGRRGLGTDEMSSCVSPSMTTTFINTP